MSKQPLYTFTDRYSGFAYIAGMIVQRGGIQLLSSEKVIPPIFEYDIHGKIRRIMPAEILSGIQIRSYKSRSSDFNRGRIADYQVSSFYKHLEHFPTLPTILLQGNRMPHPVAEKIYGSMIQLQPNSDVLKLRRKGLYEYLRKLPQLLEKVSEEISEQYNFTIDLFSVPKRNVGTYVYVGGEDGIAHLAKDFSFGLHHLIPADRVVREISSFKAAETFKKPIHQGFTPPDWLAPFVTTIRVAVVGTETSMLDSCDMFPSAVPKIAANITKVTAVGDFTKVDPQDRNIQLRPFHGGIEIYHEEVVEVDEEIEKPGGIRLVFPAGVKFAAQLQNSQATDAGGQPVDLLIDFRTFRDKGAAALFCFDEANDQPTPANLDELRALFESLPKRLIHLNGRTYQGYILNLPVFRPGQRYTSLSKPTNTVTIDFISKAILKKKYLVPWHLEREYHDLREFRKALLSEISMLRSQTDEEVNPYPGFEPARDSNSFPAISEASSFSDNRPKENSTVAATLSTSSNGETEDLVSGTAGRNEG